MKNYAYVTLLSSNSYISGVVLLAESLKKVKTQYPLVVMVTDAISEDNLKILSALGVSIVKVGLIGMPENIMEHNKKLSPTLANTWKDALTKYQVWTFTQFDKIILLDCDLLILKNIDHCFELQEFTAAVDGEYFNLWPDWVHFNTGFFVLKPDTEMFNKLVDFARNLDVENIVDYKGKPYVIADQEILNLFLPDWKNRQDLHVNKYYNVFASHVFTSVVKDVLDNAYFVHFTGKKPWDFINAQNSEDYVTILSEVCLFNVLDIELYIMAYTYICISFKNNYNVADWDKLFNDGTFDMVAAELSSIYYLNDRIARKYIEEAERKIKATGNIAIAADYAQIKTNITKIDKNRRKAKLLYKFLTDLIEVDEDLAKDYNADFYIDFSTLDYVSKKSYTFAKVDEYIDAIKEAIKKVSTIKKE